MDPNEIHTRTSVVRLDPLYDIVRLTVLPGVEETLADAQENTRAALIVGAGRRLPLLVDIRRMKSQHRDARAYYASTEAAPATRAVALLVESHVSKIVANFFIGITGTTMPTQIFTDETEAIQWLKQSME